MQPSAEANQRIARISAHLQPSNLQMEGNSSLRRGDCRVKGGASGFKVARLGAAGGISQPLSMLMKMNPLVSVVHLYDVVNSPGVTADVRGFLGQLQLENALTGMDLVIIPAGISKCCPNAIVNLISNPVNSTIPIAAEVFKKAGTYDPKRLLGVTMFNVVRANTFVAEVLGLDPREVDVPVVGGHSGVTILPLLSQAKAGAGSATLSMVCQIPVKFADACLRGLRGDAGVVECAFVASQVTELPFFASKVQIGCSGAEEVYQLGSLNEYERVGLEKAKKELAAGIQKGVSRIRK
ncbi:peroxisomal NAD-malate dehydrogenase 2 [Actinidia rufa]|uniref:malate dehydrogenase n=1 Tax=Actinidia rufa TaxID=165716 RepID=A0A7J0DFW3_9ERIC|nr:peroxisomal NAD-malate dehydrogenase 2 [Actinidia rufa]